MGSMFAGGEGEGRDAHRKLLPLSGLPLLAAEAGIVRRLHQCIEAAHKIQLLLIQELVSGRLCGPRPLQQSIDPPINQPDHVL